MKGFLSVAMLIAAFLTPGVAFAQDHPALRAHHFTLGAGLLKSGGYDLGAATAELRGNAVGASPPPFTLFTTDSHLTSVTAPEFRAGFALTRTLAIEFGASLAHPRVGVAIAGDAEAPAQELFGEELEQYQFDVGLTWQLPIPMGARVAPFVIVGGGHLRQLHEDRTLAETGQIYYAGGGARYWLRGGSAASKAIGVRGDVRINLRRKGIDFEDKMRSYPTVSLSLFIGL
jgi:hypothetical protein